MTSRQETPRPPTSTFIELHPRTRHTISMPPLYLANAVSESPKAAVTPTASIPCAHTPIPQSQCAVRTTSTITALRTIQKSSDPSFVCTICWSPQHPPAMPRVLGRSSRIVCHQCWRAVLDLSICWVCGECIVRGDDVVSLGWCFWHRGCFGCLLCGVRLGEGVLMDCVSKRDEREDRDDNGKGNGDGRRGTELDKIPLCEWCESETKIKGYGEKRVLERGLENVTRSDGGLTRCRLEKLDEDKELGVGLNLKRKQSVVVGLDGEEMVPSPPAASSSSASPKSVMKKSTRSTTLNERKIRRIMRESSTPQEEISLLKHAAKMGVSEDGNPDESAHSHSDTEPADFGQPGPSSSPNNSSNVYVSIYDPEGGAFVPSKTKPLPKWMSLLPNNVHEEREEQHSDSCGELDQRKAGAAVPRAKLPDAYADGASSIHSEDCTGEHSPQTPCPTEEESTWVSTGEASGTVTPIDKYSTRNRTSSPSDHTPTSTRRPSTIQSQSTISSLTIPSPKTKVKKPTTRRRSVSIEEKLPRPHQHPASAYRRSNRSSTFESSFVKPGNLMIQENFTVAQPLDHPPRDISERPLTPYPKIDNPFQATIIGSGNFKGPGSTSMLTSPLNNFITPRKDSCCSLSTSLESAGVDELKKRDRGESSFDSTFESFPIPEIGKGSRDYVASLSPKKSVLGIGTEVLEMCGVLSGKEKGEGREGEKESIVERIKRQRVGTISLGQVAQSVKEEKERRRAETQSQTDWDWMESEEKNQIGEEGTLLFMNGGSLKRSRGVSSEEGGGQLESMGSREGSREGSRKSSKRCLRRGRCTSEGMGEERRGRERMGSKKGKERERRGEERGKEKERRDIKGKGKMLEGDVEVGVEIETEFGEKCKREELRRELKVLFGEE